MKPDRRSIRLRNWDYSFAGYYFITVRSYKGECIFGEIRNGEMNPNESGIAIHNVWESLPKHHPIELDEMQIMPNHIHLILILCRGVACNAQKNKQGVTRYAPTTRNPNNIYSQISPVAKSVPTIIRSFKSECTKQIRYANNNQYLQIWQRNFYEHIIRNEKELHKIRGYIQNNPIKWELDHDNPDNWK